ncbi:hypothetical protein PGT21_004911 [Puccinia graminis f. sp. tritici]|uniref:Glycoside hydrolase 131 catalytic N-terminal domain-containing protein n=1 Tax=Puccinia graminis f. sp. tritici TaxID=56615 RepID=A0A5B0QMV8_PUCGR|nr:hypothetical protein PGT21_004911 [Puccinia graminis f. sp. tritici]
MQQILLLSVLLFASHCVGEEPARTELAAGNSVPKAGKYAAPTRKSVAKAVQRLFDFALTPDMKTADLDVPKSAVNKLIGYVVKGPAKPSAYLSILHPSPTKIQLAIRDDSIFIPGGKPADAQRGFRRTDVNPAIDKTTTLTGVTTWYQTIRLDSKAPLALSHGYLFASIEVPVSDHIFDIFGGSYFNPKNIYHQPMSNSRTIRVRDFQGKTLLSLPLKYDQNYNFAVTVDWIQNTLTVYSSIGTDPLKKAVGPMYNDPKAISPEFKHKGEYHLQLLKYPLPDAKIPAEKRLDVPHFGFQEPIKQEHVSFSNVFVTSGTQIEQPEFSDQ